jgi:hypothetical protein
MRVSSIYRTLTILVTIITSLSAGSITDWSFRRPITLTPATPVANYQVLITLTPSNFNYLQCKSDGVDIRFVNSFGDFLPYWIATWNNLDTSLIWVKVRDQDCNKIFILYGNANATSESNAHATMDLYEDFSADTITATINTYNYKILGLDGAYKSDEKSVAFYGDVTNPVAIYSEIAKQTFIIYQTKVPSDNYKANTVSYDHNTNNFSGPIEINGTGLSSDAHGAPSITISPDGYLYAFYGTHGDTIQHYKKSSNPYDISSWSEEQTILTNKKGFTYPQVFFIDDTLHMFFRQGGSDVDNFSYMYYRTISHTKFDGVEWTEPVPLTDFSDFSDQKTVSGMYHVTYVNPTDNTIHIAYNWFQSASATRYHLYYMKSTDNGKTWTEADGTPLTMPVDEYSSEKIVDSGSEFCNVCLGDIHTTPAGFPLILFNLATVFKLARWNGSIWILTDIVAVDHNFDYGTLVIDSESQYRAYITVGEDRGGAIMEYLTTDSGVTWQYQKTIVNGSAAAPMNVYKSSSDKELELVFCGGEASKHAVGAWGSNATYTSTITKRHLGEWEIYESDSGTVTIENEQLKLNGYYGKYSYISQDIDVNSGFCVEAKIKVSTDDKGSFNSPGIRLWWDDNNFGHNISLLNNWDFKNFQAVKIDNPDHSSQMRGSGNGGADYYWYRIEAISDSFSFYMSENGNNWKDWNSISPNQGEYFCTWNSGKEPINLKPFKIALGRGQHYWSFGVYDEFQNNSSKSKYGSIKPAFFDNLIIRKYEKSDPEFFIGAEELNDSSLPIELNFFTVEQQSNSIILKWQTASELENQGFIVERSELSDNSSVNRKLIASFNEHLTLTGKGSCSNAHNYEYIDLEITSGTRYTYWLADVDYTGTITYHEPVEIYYLQSEEHVLTVYPNPSNHQIHIDYQLSSISDVQITIYNLLGEKVKTLYTHPNQAAGKYSLSWNGANDYNQITASGMYLICSIIDGKKYFNKVQLLK